MRVKNCRSVGVSLTQDCRITSPAALTYSSISAYDKNMARQIFVDVLVSNPFHRGNRGKHLKVKAFVDNGSTDSAMPRNFLKTLHIKPEGWERYEIWGENLEAKMGICAI